MKPTKRLSLISAALAFVASLALLNASAKAELFLYVAHFSSDDITVISIPDHEIVGNISLGAPRGAVDSAEGGVFENRGAHIDDIIGSPDGRVLYVNRGIETGHKLGSPTKGEIVAVDTRNERVLWSVPIDDGWPHHISLSDDGRYLFAPLFDRPYVAVVDTQKPGLADPLHTPWGGHGTRLSPDGKRLYVGSILTDSLYVVDIARNQIVQILSFRDGVRPFAFDKAETVLYTQLSRLHGFAVADLKTGEVTKTVRMPGLPTDFKPPVEFPHNVNHGLELSPDEKYLVAAGTAVNKAYIYSHPELELIETIDIGNDSNWVVFSPDSRFAYITNRTDNTVSIVSMEQMKEIKRVPTGGERPGRMRVVDVPDRR